VKVPTFRYSIGNSPTHLLKFSQKMPQAQLGAADLQGHGPPSRSIPIIAMRAIRAVEAAFENWEAMQKDGR
jgi:hypothetical protein